MKPITGRKHQLRKQLFNIGHPIYGDDKYKLFDSIKKTNKAKELSKIVLAKHARMKSR